MTGVRDDVGERRDFGRDLLQVGRELVEADDRGGAFAAVEQRVEVGERDRTRAAGSRLSAVFDVGLPGLAGGLQLAGQGQRRRRVDAAVAFDQFGACRPSPGSPCRARCRSYSGQPAAVCAVGPWPLSSAISLARSPWRHRVVVLQELAFFGAGSSRGRARSSSCRRPLRSPGSPSTITKRWVTGGSSVSGGSSKGGFSGGGRCFFERFFEDFFGSRERRFGGGFGGRRFFFDDFFDGFRRALLLLRAPRRVS